MQVLIVEDNPSDVKLLKLWLGGCKSIRGLYSVTDGQRSLAFVRGEAEYLGRQRPDLILLDSQLPDMHCLELLAKLRQEPEAAQAGIMILAGAYSPHDAQRARELGAEAYLAKPFEAGDFEALVNRMEAYWNQRQATRRGENGL